MPVVHCKHSDFDIYIGRPSDNRPMHYGNPFSNRTGTKATHIVDDPIGAFESWLRGWDYWQVEQERRKWILERLPALRGKVLGCWCAPNPCHGDVLERMAVEAGVYFDDEMAKLVNELAAEIIPSVSPDATSDVVRDTGYTVTAEGPHYRLTLPDGRTGLFKSEQSAKDDGERLCQPERIFTNRSKRD